MLAQLTLTCDIDTLAIKNKKRQNINFLWFVIKCYTEVDEI
jgi:hypothetical protein